MLSGFCEAEREIPRAVNLKGAAAVNAIISYVLATIAQA